MRSLPLLRQGKYVEAEIAKNRLEELKLHEENRRKEAMRSRQVRGVLAAHFVPEPRHFLTFSPLPLAAGLMVTA